MKAGITQSKTIKFLFLFLASNQKKCSRRRKIKRKVKLVFILKTKPVAISTMESEMSDDPKPAPDLLNVLDDILEASDEKQA